MVIEKPFGHDLASAQELNRVVGEVFDSGSVFRIDHYLGKETVQNILALRFANEMFEPIWNANYVDHVQITMAEDVGIGGRAGYYDGIGAARDVIQNHLLQLLALTAMEEPVSFDGRLGPHREGEGALGGPAARRPRRMHTARGQYAAGWQGGEPGGRVPARRTASHRTSTTETYAAIRLDIDTRRWAGVPFYLRTGKRLGRRVTEVAVVFKRAPHLPFEATATEELGQNALVIRVQPDEGVTLRFGSKVPGTAMEVRDVTMDFAYGESFTESSPEAYERLILDVLIGEAPLFPRHEEVEQSWRILDPIEEFWATRGRARPVPRGHLGPGLRRRDARPRRAYLEAAVIVDLTDTTAGAIAAALVQARHSAGVPAVGMVLTLVIVDRRGRPLRRAARRPGRRPRAPCAGPRGDPAARSQGQAAPRRRGAVPRRLGAGRDRGHAPARRARPTTRSPSCVPLLLPDAPVVAWWPGESPERAGQGPGRPARPAPDHRRRAAADDPHAELLRRSAGYAPGDTDLAWTRITPWRTLLAAALDQPFQEVSDGSVACRARSARAPSCWPSGWRWRLGVPITAGGLAADRASPGSGWSAPTATIEVSRPDGRVAHLRRPGQPERQVSLQRRETAEIIAEELRRLDPDDVFGEVIGRLTGRVEAAPTHPGEPDDASGVSGVASSE